MEGADVFAAGETTKGVPCLGSDRTCLLSLPGLASPIMEALFRLDGTRLGWTTAKSTHGRLPESADEMHMEKQPSRTRANLELEILL